MSKRVYFVLLLIFYAATSIAQARYQRIVSLAPSLTQSLYYLDAQERLIGCTSFCLAAKNDNKEVVASAVKANLEKIIAMKADLVLVLGLTDPREIETLRKAGIRVELFQSPKSFKEICSQFIHLGNLIGEGEKARQIVRESERRVETIASGIQWEKRPLIFFQIGTDPIFSVLTDTFMDDYIRLLGADNIAKTLKRGTVSREFVIARNPDYIFIATLGVAAVEEKKNWSRYSRLTASRKGQIFIIDSELACQPTPVTFVKTLEILGKIVNGQHNKS